MKATGIVRRIDELGRIVIPKEICRSLHIKEGDPLELYTYDNGDLVFRKHDYTTTLKDTIARLKESLQENEDLKNPNALISKVTEIEHLLMAEMRTVHEA